MTEFLENLKARRTVRNFQDRKIPEQMLEQLFEAVRWSPSWANTQCWEIVVVSDDSIKANLKDTISPKNPATKSITGAPVVLAICGRKNRSGFYRDVVTTKHGDWMMFDLGIACQSIMLAAHDMGLGSVVVGLFDHNKAADILRVPEDCEVVSLIPVGFPAKVSKPPKRKLVEEFVYSNTM